MKQDQQPPIRGGCRGHEDDKETEDEKDGRMRMTTMIRTPRTLMMDEDGAKWNLLEDDIQMDLMILDYHDGIRSLFSQLGPSGLMWSVREAACRYNVVNNHVKRKFDK
jgi:hypothetical protein